MADHHHIETRLERLLRRASPQATGATTAELPRLVVLGGGPAGLGAAYQLARHRLARVTLLEQGERVGGNSASFLTDGIWCDYGSHRLHPACDPVILRDLRELLGDDLLDRPRHGRIRLGGRWIHFPLKPLDLLLGVPPAFALGVASDLVAKLLPRNSSGPETFASILERGLGKTICREFYFPYAVKLWGVPPEELATTTAKRRVSGSSISKILRKVLGAVPGFKPAMGGRFFYPRKGYGQLSDALCAAAEREGAEILLGARVTAVERTGQRVTAVRFERGGSEQRIEAAHVWSTLPVNLLIRMISPPPPAEVLSAAEQVRFRGMILVYLVLEQDQFTEFDAHYFPEAALPVSRLSEPKNYSGSTEPRGRTLLCAELPDDPGGPYWERSDEELGQLLCGWLEQAGLPVRARVLRAFTRRTKFAYPVYRRGYEEHFAKMDDWLSSLDGVLHYGRQALFAHDNTHHALYMAYGAADCFAPDGRFDKERWKEFRRVFETHVVED
jgi:protoporphyrinogen oxidase